MAALLLPQILPVFSVVAPCQRGASPVSVRRRHFTTGCWPWQDLPPLEAPAGTTALSGQVLRPDGRPLMDTRLAIGEHEARTDRTGRFLLLLPGVSAGRAGGNWALGIAIRRFQQAPELTA
jgi:hypothetical protein